MTTKATKPVHNTQPKLEHRTFQHRCVKENFILVWLDENYNEDTSHCDTLTEQLKSRIKQFDLFNDVSDCVDFVKKIQDRDVYLIITRPEENTLTHAHQLDQVKAIFIFADRNSSNEPPPVKQWQKVQDVYRSIENLCKGVKKTAEEADKDFKAFRTVAKKDIGKLGTDELDPAFMYMQVIKEILIEMTYDGNSVKELVTYCKDNRETIKEKPSDSALDEFEANYGKINTPVWWYTRNSFLYRLVNRAMRVQEFDTIFRVGFFVKDLHEQIVQRQKDQMSVKTRESPTAQSNGEQTSSEESKPDFHRGQGMSSKDFATLQEHGLIAFNCFLSTTRDPKVAEGFMEDAQNNGAEIGIIFKIFVGTSIDSATYADIDEISFFQQDEKEVLFTFGTVFRIVSVKQQLTKPQVYDVTLHLTDDKDKTLYALQTRIQQESQGFSLRYRWGALMIRVGQYRKARITYTELLEITSDKVEQANIHFQLGFIEYKVGNPKKALKFYQQALPIHQETFLEEHENVATVYSNIGLAYDALGEYERSLECYQKAQKIYAKFPRSASSLAVCYNNIAAIYHQQGNDDTASYYYKKALEIYKKSDMNHPDVATLHNNIGIIHQKKHEDEEACHCFQQAVNTGQKMLPGNHPDLLKYRKHLEEVKKKVDKYL